MGVIPVIIHRDRLEVSDYHKAKIRQAVTDNEGKPLRGGLELITPESRQQRKYLMGGLMPLLVYLDGNDYRDDETLEHYFEHYKAEFTPEVLKIDGKIQTFGKSTKGAKALRNFIDKLQDHLNENYGISYDNPAINPDKFVEWRDTISMSTTESYIEYCVKMKWLSQNN
jgi:hypothetical protein